MGEYLCETELYARILGSLLGGAIGDAMGGPVEGMTHHEIDARHGMVDTLLPYGAPGDYHANWDARPGAWTDDTRLKHILCDAIIARGDLPHRGDLVRALGDYYHGAEDERARGFVEEYYLKGLYGERMQIWGGQPANGAVMMNSPLGMICPCDPRTAFALAYELGFLSEAYSAYTAGMAAAAVAAAMCPGATPEDVVRETLAVSRAHHVNGPIFERWAWADAVGRPVENAVEAALDIARQLGDARAIREPLYEALNLSPLFSEAAQTIAVALAMFLVADGDPRKAIIGAVNYGRDCDSYASVAGAIAGALRGVEVLPADWVATVRAANAYDIDGAAQGLCEVAVARHRRAARITGDVGKLLGSGHEHLAPGSNERSVL